MSFSFYNFLFLLLVFFFIIFLFIFENKSLFAMQRLRNISQQLVWRWWNSVLSLFSVFFLVILLFSSFAHCHFAKWFVLKLAVSLFSWWCHRQFHYWKHFSFLRSSIFHFNGDFDWITSKSKRQQHRLAQWHNNENELTLNVNWL